MAPRLWSSALGSEERPNPTQEQTGGCCRGSAASPPRAFREACVSGSRRTSCRLLLSVKPLGRHDVPTEVLSSGISPKARSRRVRMPPVSASQN